MYVTKGNLIREMQNIIFMMDRSGRILRIVLLFQTFLALLVVALLWTFGLLWIESSGTPVKDETTGFITYQKNPIVWLMRYTNH